MKNLILIIAIFAVGCSDIKNEDRSTSGTLQKVEIGAAKFNGTLHLQGTLYWKDDSQTPLLLNNQGEHTMLKSLKLGQPYKVWWTSSGYLIEIKLIEK